MPQIIGNKKEIKSMLQSKFNFFPEVFYFLWLLFLSRGL